MDGYEVFHWPEFLAFAQRCGVDTTKAIKSISFSLEEGSSVLITLVQMGEDMQPDLLPQVIQVKGEIHENCTLRGAPTVVTERDNRSFPPVETTNLQTELFKTAHPHSSTRE